MRKIGCRVTVGLICMTLVILAWGGPAHAALFTLNNWNDPFLDLSTDSVTVDVTTVGSNTQLIVTWVAGNSGLTAIGIDQFFYDSNTTCCSTAPASWTAPPPSEGFDSTGVFTADGFGTFETRGASPGGTLLTITFVLNGLASTLDSASDFAVHVRYGNDCSGFVSGRTDGTDGGTSPCGVVPEPGTLLLLGSGLLGLGAFGLGFLKRP